MPLYYSTLIVPLIDPLKRNSQGCGHFGGHAAQASLLVAGAESEINGGASMENPKPLSPKPLNPKP